MTKPQLHLAALAIALVAGAIGFWIATREQPALPPAPVAAVTPEFRPEFALAAVEGPQRSSKEFEGKAVIVNFWATWCAPCRREIPLLNRLQAEHADRGLQIVGIALDTQENVAAYQKEVPLQYVSLYGELDAMAVGRAFGQDLYGLPVSVFTDKSGRIVAVHTGELTEADAEGYLAKIL
jgi:thiol-disulfide isomerase/thioredoxin